jgi:hypothetical protein
MYEFYLKYFKIFLTYMVLRELPLKNFYARSFVIGTCLYYFNYHWWWLGSKVLYYTNERDKRELENYPRLKEMVTKRIASREISPVMLESDYWWTAQNPVFYHHHFKHYRYNHRTKREVPWDGTYNQPVLPFTFLNDRTGFVHNGLLENTQPTANAAW